MSLLRLVWPVFVWHFLVPFVVTFGCTQLFAKSEPVFFFFSDIDNWIVGSGGLHVIFLVGLQTLNNDVF